jgi:hypothetical protein
MIATEKTAKHTAMTSSATRISAVPPVAIDVDYRAVAI